MVDVYRHPLSGGARRSDGLEDFGLVAVPFRGPGRRCDDSRGSISELPASTTRHAAALALGNMSVKNSGIQANVVGQPDALSCLVSMLKGARGFEDERGLDVESMWRSAWLSVI